jgi:hypothetical protein
MGTRSLAGAGTEESALLGKILGLPRRILSSRLPGRVMADALIWCVPKAVVFGSFP